MNEIAVYPHKTCIFALEKSCLTSKANLCIMQKLEPLLKIITSIEVEHS